MTKSTGVGRGKGGGRPRKIPPEKPAVLVDKIGDIKAREDAARQRTIKAFETASAGNMAATPKTIKELAGAYTELAIETLAEISLAGDKDAARVAAANSLIKIAQGPTAGAGKDEPDVPGKPAPDSWDALLQ